MCLSETFLDSSIPNVDNRINIAGYSLLRADHPSNTKKGGVCVYYKDFLPLIRKFEITDLKECLVTEITVENEKWFLTCLYRLPSQNCDQFSYFCKDHHALVSLVISILNAQNGIRLIKICSWRNTAYTTTVVYSQLINKAIHCGNGSSSCIYLIFTFNTNLVTDLGVDPTLYKTSS